MKHNFQHTCLNWTAVFALLLTSFVATAETTLTKATDLTTDAREATQKRIPLLILYSLPGCPHCEAIRRSHLLALEKEQPPRVIARQIDMHSSQELIDFKGAKTTHAEFMRVRKIKFAPIVVLLGTDGDALAEPLTGAMIPDFYGLYLEEAIVGATRRLRDSPPAGPKAKP